MEALNVKGQAMIKTGEVDKEKFWGVYTENSDVKVDDYEVKGNF